MDKSAMSVVPKELIPFIFLSLTDLTNEIFKGV